MQTKETISSI